MEHNYEISRSFNITRRLSKTYVTTRKRPVVNNAMVQDGETPAEDSSQLRSELEDMSEQLLLVIKPINKTNGSQLSR